MTEFRTVRKNETNSGGDHDGSRLVRFSMGSTTTVIFDNDNEIDDDCNVTYLSDTENDAVADAAASAASQTHEITNSGCSSTENDNKSGNFDDANSSGENQLMKNDKQSSQQPENRTSSNGLNMETPESWLSKETDATTEDESEESEIDVILEQVRSSSIYSKTYLNRRRIQANERGVHQLPFLGRKSRQLRVRRLVRDRYVHQHQNEKMDAGYHDDDDDNLANVVTDDDKTNTRSNLSSRDHDEKVTADPGGHQSPSRSHLRSKPMNGSKRQSSISKLSLKTGRKNSHRSHNRKTLDQKLHDDRKKRQLLSKKDRHDNKDMMNDDTSGGTNSITTTSSYGETSLDSQSSSSVSQDINGKDKNTSRAKQHTSHHYEKKHGGTHHDQRQNSSLFFGSNIDREWDMVRSRTKTI